MQNRSLLALILVFAQAGCLSATMRPSVYGRQVTVEPDRGGGGKAVQGELLAVSEDRLWIRDESGVRELPLSSVGEVRVRRHRVTGKKAMTWAAAGALVSGVGLTGSCASVEGAENCGMAGLSAAGLWLLVGGLAAVSVDASSWLRIGFPKPGDLRRFARFPQGPPEATELLIAGPPAPSER